MTASVSILAASLALLLFVGGVQAVKVTTADELSTALDNGDPIEVADHISFVGKNRLSFTRNAQQVAIWGNCKTPLPEGVRSETLVSAQRQLPQGVCSITFEDGGFEFESIDESPSKGYRLLMLSNLVISSHAAAPAYGISATKMLLWMSSVEWSGFASLAVFDGAAYLSDVAIADNQLALSIGLGNRQNSTAPFARKAVLSQVHLYNNQKALAISAYTTDSVVTVVSNNLTLAKNFDGISLDLELDVNVTLAVAGDFQYAVPAPDAAGPYRIQRQDFNPTTPGLVAQAGNTEFQWLLLLKQKGVLGIQRLLTPFGQPIISEQPLPVDTVDTGGYYVAPPPPNQNVTMNTTVTNTRPAEASTTQRSSAHLTSTGSAAVAVALAMALVL